MTHVEQAERDAHGRWRRGSGNPAGHAAQRRRRAVDRERAPLDDDHAGLLWRVEGGRLMIMSAYSAIIETTTGQQRLFHRRSNRPGELALAWEITSGESQVGAQ